MRSGIIREIPRVYPPEPGTPTQRQGVTAREDHWSKNVRRDMKNLEQFTRFRYLH
jgi:hypothetical protein